MPAPLSQIVADVRAALERRRASRPPAELRSMLVDTKPARGFAETLKKAYWRPSIIAEVKKSSPSAGTLVGTFDAPTIARVYEHFGAACLSVLTEETHFQGSLSNLWRVHNVVHNPVLQKDFLVDPYQVEEARAWGADAILLIAAILDDDMLRRLADRAHELGMDVLLEVHDEEELERAVKVPTAILGINNRNLKTYEIDLETFGRLASRLGDRQGDRVLVSESGLRNREQIVRMASQGAAAVLIGEALLREPDVGAALEALLGLPDSPSTHAH